MTIVEVTKDEKNRLYLPAAVKSAFEDKRELRACQFHNIVVVFSEPVDIDTMKLALGSAFDEIRLKYEDKNRA